VGGVENQSSQLQTELSSLRLTLDQQMADLVAKSSKLWLCELLDFFL